jgi:hypothetical protein
VLDDPQAAYVLVATCEYIRLYPISHVVAGDRTVAKRVHLPGPLLFASCFTAAGGPALAALVGQGGEVALQVSWCGEGRGGKRTGQRCVTSQAGNHTQHSDGRAS